MDPSNPILPANRAMALLKQGMAAAAEADCTIALRCRTKKDQFKVFRQDKNNFTL